MTSRAVTSETERGLLLKFLGGHPLPFTVTVAKGRKRSIEQNNLQQKWLDEIAVQLADMTGDEWTREKVRGYCKLHFGVPILREEDELFREKYDRFIKPHAYEDKLLMMQEPAPFPVTSLMTTRQKTRYLDAVHKHFAERGLVLTMPAEAA